MTPAIQMDRQAAHIPLEVTPAASSLEALHGLAPYCYRDLVAQVGDDPALLSRLHGLFESMAARTLGSLAAAIERADLAQVERDAHALKGSLATVGASAASACAGSLEVMAQQGNRAGIQALLPQLAAYSDQVADVLRAAA